MRPLTKHWKKLLAGGVILFLVVNWDSILALLLMGYWPQSHVETLRHPIAVNSYAAGGLRLADGTTRQLPGFKSLPDHSLALDTVTSQGIEITPEGRVIGLVKVWHWCGNDALRNDVRRIDVADLLEFLREGEFEKSIAQDAPKPYRPGGFFTRYGWYLSERIRFDHFVKGDWPSVSASEPATSTIQAQQ